MKIPCRAQGEQRLSSKVQLSQAGQGLLSADGNGVWQLRVSLWGTDYSNLIQ